MTSESPAAIRETLLRFFGSGDRPDYAQLLDVLRRRPYDEVIDDLRRIVGEDIVETTDINYDLSFMYAAGPFAIRLSMAGPFALLMREKGTAGSRWYAPVEQPTDDLERDVLSCLRRHGFLMMGAQELETEVAVWPDEPPVALYRLLIADEDEFPWEQRHA